METTVEIKYNVKKLRSEIKELAEKQKYYKNQRRTKRLVGEREMEPWSAAYEHFNNREKLRLLYAASGLIRGKSFAQTENNHSEENHPLEYYKDDIQKLVDSYIVE